MAIGRPREFDPDRVEDIAMKLFLGPAASRALP
jgi:hypothetical protein